MTRVTLALRPDLSVHLKPPQPVTMTDPAKVGQLVKLINGMPPIPLGTYNCAPGGFGELILTFAASQVPPARATISLDGCGLTDLTVSGRQDSVFGAYGSGRRTAAKALKIADLDWDLARYLSF